MSIESREIKDIHTLYQNLYERVDIKSLDLSKPNGGMSNDDYNALTSSQRNRIQSHIRNQKNKTDMKDAGVKPNDGPSTVSNVNPEGKAKKIDNQSDNTSSDKKEYGGTGTKTVLNKDGSKTTTTGHSDDLRSDSFGGTKASSEKGKKILSSLKKEKNTPPAPKLDRESGTPPNRTAPKLDRDEVKSSSSNSSSDVGSDGLSSKNKRFTTKTVNKVNSRGRVTGTKEVRVQSQQSDGGKPIRNSRGRVTGTTKPTDAEGKSFPSTAEIRAKAKKDGGSGLSNIPSKEGNAVINKKPLNPDFGKKPVIQKDAPVKPIAKPVVKMSNLERQNRARFGDAAVDKLKTKQTDFRAMQSKSMMPGAKPGAAKAEFAKKHPNSNIAKDLKKSKRVTQVMDLESYDAYDLVLIHLLETNQVESVEEANYVMTEMDGKTILEIKRLMESMPSHVRDSIGRQYGTGKYKGEKYTIEDKKNVVNWYSRIKA